MVLALTPAAFAQEEEAAPEDDGAQPVPTEEPAEAQDETAPESEGEGATEADGDAEPANEADVETADAAAGAEVAADAESEEVAEAAAADTEAVEEDAGPEAASEAAASQEENGEDALTDEEQAALDEEAAAMEAVLMQESADQSAMDKYSLDLYGFSDFTYWQGFNDTDRGQFFVGRLNLYMAGKLGDNWSSLAEVRFTYLPHGTNVAGEETVENLGTDYTDLFRTVPVGGIVIERAWLEYAPHPLLKIRAGHFLTPYGIWNVDHGSPVIIGTRRPYVIGERFLPEWQTGLQVHGSTHLGRAEYGYHVTLSNGRGPISMYNDLDTNKAVGGRLFANFDSKLGQLDVGISAYGGTYTDATQDDFGGIAVTEQYDEFSYGGDLKYEKSGVLLQGELLANERVYREGARPADPYTGALIPDHRRWGAYIMGGYRFDFLGSVTPFFAYDYGDPGYGGQVAAVWGGLNVRPHPRVVLKTQYTYSWFLEDGPLSDFHWNALATQAAWSF